MSNRFTLPVRIFAAVLVTAAAVCLICDCTIAGGITWAWYTTASLALVLFVGIAFLIPCKRKTACSLAVLTGLIFPYLAVLAYLTGVQPVMSVGFPAAGISLAYLWTVYAIFLKVKRKTAAAALSCILAVPLAVAVNAVVAGVLSLPFWSMWDSVSIAVLILSAMILFRK